ncbi:MAG: adenylate/guanylate cyclase domain-containing protein [Leptolyngbyaceae cyanobacterium bins.302]|nr:adenylate/guanylate cyclase domain-containing protein [Leptolyngbyaceae cyanobacterium bins.302]
MWDKLKRQIWQRRGILIAAPSVTIFVLLLRFLGLLELLEMAAYDQFLRLRPEESPDSRIVIIEMNEPEVQKLHPLSDAALARIITNLRKYKPIGIGLDWYWDKPRPPGYQALANVFKTTPNLVGVQKLGSEGSYPVAPPPVLKAQDQVGSNDFPSERDGKFRRIPLYVSDSEGNNVFSFSWMLAYLYLKDKGVPVTQTEGDLLIQVGSTIIPLFSPNTGGYVRAEDWGYQVLINYRRSAQSFQFFSVIDALQDRIPPEAIRGKIVMLGSTAESLKDRFYTPFSGSLTSSARMMSGVEIHAHNVSQILSSALDGRPFIRTWDEPWEWLWVFSWGTLAAVMSWKQRYTHNAIKQVPWATIGLILSAIALVGGSYVAFLGGWWIPVVPAFLAFTGSAIVVTAYIARSAGEIRKAFGRFVTDEIVANLLENPEGLKLGGERRKITILTSDIRGFTAISERLPPEEVIKIINLYLGYMADVITQYQGTIDEFMGDGILVLFGAPTVREDDAERAIACALAMQLAMKPVNEKMHQLGLPQLEMGIGINTGEVVVGNIGSEKRTKYGIVGDQVNLTYRIEGYTVGGQIFATESTLEAILSDVITDEQREVQPKGVHKPIMIYEIVGITGKYNLHLTKQEEDFFPLPEPILVRYATLEGKQVDRAIVTGKLITLSAREAEMYVDSGSAPAPLTNLKLNLCFPGDEVASDEDVYAKVLEKPATDNRFYIRFTNRPPEIEARLNELYTSLQSKPAI